MKSRFPPPLKNRWAFTLSEVLITLVIIGVVAAITIPMINVQARKEQYRSSILKMLSVLNQANLKYFSLYGENPQCGYWTINPYSSAGNGAVCVRRDEQGRCLENKLKDGSDLPADYNGFFDDCTSLWKSYYRTLNVQKICTSNSYSNGCIPEYKGREEVYGEKNPDASDYDTMAAVSSAGFMKSQIQSGSAIVLTDGTIIFTYMRESARYYAIDVNGQKGPNKWGTDVYVILPTMDNGLSAPKAHINNTIMQKGGFKVNNILYKK